MSSENNKTKKPLSPFVKFLISKGGTVVLFILFAAIIYGTVALLVTNEDLFWVGYVIYGLCMFFGWKALSKIQPVYFLWMSYMGWVIYFVIKGVLSVIIGAIVAPFWISRKITNYIMESVDYAIDSL